MLALELFDALLHSPVIAVLALLSSIAFTTVAALVPPNAGNLVGAIFISSFASFLGGEEEPSPYDQEIEDADV
jgi:hypothetical protein